jgi:hypothetical protein
VIDPLDITRARVAPLPRTDLSPETWDGHFPEDLALLDLSLHRPRFYERCGTPGLWLVSAALGCWAFFAVIAWEAHYMAVHL